MTSPDREYFFSRLDTLERDSLGLVHLEVEDSRLTWSARLHDMSVRFHNLKDEGYLPHERYELLTLVAIIAAYLKDGL